MGAVLGQDQSLWLPGRQLTLAHTLFTGRTQSERLVTHAKEFAARHRAPYLYLQGRHRKDDLVREQIRARRLSEGLVCILCCQETCRTVKLRYGEGRPRLVFTCRPQRVLYYYFLDPQFGLRHVRVQTWFRW